MLALKGIYCHVSILCPLALLCQGLSPLLPTPCHSPAHKLIFHNMVTIKTVNLGYPRKKTKYYCHTHTHSTKCLYKVQVLIFWFPSSSLVPASDLITVMVWRSAGETSESCNGTHTCAEKCLIENCKFSQNLSVGINHMGIY